MINIPLNCKGCGKCCIWPQYEDLSIYKLCKACPESIELYYGRCQYLNDNNECNIYYDGRPDVCKTMKQGSSECIEFLTKNK